MRTEDISKTTFTSGFIDRKGKFYPCFDERHGDLEYDLLEVKILDRGKSYGSKHYEQAGWLVLTTSFTTECEFTFNFESAKKGLTKKQIQSITDYKNGKKEQFINFNYNWYHVPDIEKLFDKKGKRVENVDRLDCGRSGNKANQLALLQAKGFPVPEFETIESWGVVHADKLKDFRNYNSWFMKRNALVSIRSSSKHSLPGIFKTILNVDLNSDEFEKAALKVAESMHTDEAYALANKIGADIDHQTVIVQKMIQSDKDSNSGSAVIHANFDGIEGVYVIQKTGDVLVSNSENGIPIKKLEKDFPEVFKQIQTHCANIVKLYGKPQEIEIAWENCEVYIIQSRELNPAQPIFEDIPQGYNPKFKVDTILHGLRGALLKKNPIEEPFILWTNEITTEILLNIDVCRGIITKRGSAYSHAANICRRFNIPYSLYNGDLTSVLNKTVFHGNGFIYNS